MVCATLSIAPGTCPSPLTGRFLRGFICHAWFWITPPTAWSEPSEPLRASHSHRVACAPRNYSLQRWARRRFTWAPCPPPVRGTAANSHTTPPRRTDSLVESLVAAAAVTGRLASSSRHRDGCFQVYAVAYAIFSAQFLAVLNCRQESGALERSHANAR
jgi:hypothetical protein